MRLQPGGGLAVDGFLATSLPSIYACGDVAGPHRFTHAATHQAWCAAVNTLFSGLKRIRAYRAVVP